MSVYPNTDHESGTQMPLWTPIPLLSERTIMALGTCRHCGAGGIPTDAPICRSCAGWKPNPGLITRTGVAVNRVLALLCFSLGVAMVGMGITKPEGLMGAWAGFVIFLLPGSVWLFKSVFRPYGQPPTDY
jgi:ribosomal protein L40E